MQASHVVSFDLHLRAYIGIGANAGDRFEMPRRAISALSALPGVAIAARSPLFLTEPQGFGNQPWFVNQVVEVTVQENWTAPEFLELLLEVESTLGRVRSPDQPRFGPRAIDLDLLLFGAEQHESDSCVIPHPRMHLRAFVLVPLWTVAPSARVNGLAIGDWLGRLAWRLDGARIYQRS